MTLKKGENFMPQTHLVEGTAQAPVVIVFKKTPPEQLEVVIKTARLYMRSVRENDLSDYIRLFGDPKNMENYATGKTKDAEYVAGRINTWVERWKKGDPFAGFAVFHKETKEFIGHIVVGYGDRPGQSEMAVLFHSRFWNQGYGTEAVSAMLQAYVPELAEQGFEVEGKLLDEVHATTKADLTAGNRMLSKFMRLGGQEEKYGALRNNYVLKLKTEENRSLWNRVSAYFGRAA